MSGPVYIICGGTGGHLAPGIATAQSLADLDVPVNLVVSDREVDSRLLKAYPDIPYKRARGAPFALNPAGLFRFIALNTRSFVRGFLDLKRVRPPVILAFGGFLSVSYVIAAWLLGIPVVLHEANRVAGRSIRFLSTIADCIFLPDGVALPGIEPSRMRREGMPLRKEIHHIPRDEIRRRLGIPFHAKVLVVVGGSQGAQPLNDWVERQYKSLAADGIWTILVAGPGKNTLPETETLTSDQGDPVELRTFAFHHALHELFSCADVVVARAGAGSMAELVACLAPSILVPYPYAADKHQLANARYLERRGGCIVIEQDEIRGLYREVLDLIYNDWLLSRIRGNLRKLTDRNPADVLARHILKVCTRAEAPDDSTGDPEAGKLAEHG